MIRGNIVISHKMASCYPKVKLRHLSFIQGASAPSLALPESKEDSVSMNAVAVTKTDGFGIVSLPVASPQLRAQRGYGKSGEVIGDVSGP